MPSKGSPKNKWTTKYALNAVKRKADVWEFYKKRRSRARYERYCRACNNVLYMVRLAKMNFERSCVQEIKNGDTAAFYSYLRSKTKIKEEMSSMKHFREFSYVRVPNQFLSLLQLSMKFFLRI